MNELIRVDYRNDRYTTSARDLWEFLDKPHTEFMKWFSRYSEYGFIENADYRVIDKLVENPLGGRPATDYEITVDMAKELAMLQKTEKGKVARRYFIELEKKWNSPEAIMARALKMADIKLLEYKNNILQLESKIELNKPKVIFAEALEISENSILVGELAKLLARNGIEEMGQNRLFKWLRSKGYLHKSGEQYNLPTQYSIELGLIETKTTTINNPDGSIRVTKTPKITGKGQIYFVNKFKNKEIA